MACCVKNQNCTIDKLFKRKFNEKLQTLEEFSKGFSGDDTRRAVNAAYYLNVVTGIESCIYLGDIVYYEPKLFKKDKRKWRAWYLENRCSMTIDKADSLLKVLGTLNDSVVTTQKQEITPVKFRPTAYEVVKLDSLNDVYLIYAKKGGTLFKIASKRTSKEKCSRIEVGEKYPFYLESLFPRNFKGKYDLSPKSLPHVSGVDFYGTTVTLEPDSINDLFLARNVRGLCFIK
ncbi:hypothetical protein GCM10009122_16010 [Fulvivirga kasyanovii]